MNQESNFYRVYRLAYSDRTQSLKSLILLAVLLSLFSIASLLFLVGLNTNDYKALIISGLFWILGFSLLTIFYLVAPKSQLFLGLLLFGAAFFVPLVPLKNYDQFLLYLYLGIVVLLMISYFRFKGEADSLINLNLSRIIGKISLLFTLILFITLVSLIFYDRYNISFLNNPIEIEKTISNYLTKTNPGFEINFSNNLDNLLSKYINQQSHSLNINKSVNQILLNQTRQTLSQMLNIPLTGKETILEIIQKYFILNWNNFNINLKIVIGFLVFSVVLSLIGFINYFLNIIFTILGFSLLKFLLAIKFVKIKMVGIEKEELSLV
ncbi:MAG: hypothetical protein ACPLW7_04010 [Minisyncoccia bacterium]